MKIKKIMSLIVTCSLALSLMTGCGDKSTTSQQNNDVDQETDAQVTESSENSAETTEITFPLEEPIEIDLFICSGDASYMFEDTAIYKYMEEKTNVKINVTNVSTDELQDKRNILINSANYPDVFMKASLGNSDALSLAEEGIILQLDELIEEYAPNYKALIDERDAWGEICATDGHQYTFAQIGKTSMQPYYFINQQWLDNLGLNMPTNADEFYNVLKAFKEQDADGDGDPNNEIPWIADGSLLTVECLLPYFGIQHQDYWSPFYLSDDGESIGFYANEEEYKEILQFMTKCYEEGLLYKESFGINLDQVRAMTQTGTSIGVFCDWSVTEAFGAYDSEENTIGMQYTAMVPWDGGKVISYGALTSGTFSITDYCEYPEIMVAWIDLLYSEEGVLTCQYGIEGDTYDIVDDQIKIRTESATWGENVDKAMLQMGGGAPSPTMLYSEQYKEYVDVTINPFAYDAEDTYNYFKELDKVYNPFPTINMTTEESEEFWGYWADLNTYRLSYRAEVITGEKDLESTWDEYVETLSKMHVDRMLEIFNAAYDRYKESK